ncbi:MAG TPA: hypothetical protein VGD23_09270 [Sphingomicrobium sp.]
MRLLVVDGTFHAIATILHRVPRDGEPRGKRKTAAPAPADRDPDLREIPEGWVRFAL